MAVVVDETRLVKGQPGTKLTEPPRLSFKKQLPRREPSSVKLPWLELPDMPPPESTGSVPPTYSGWNAIMQRRWSTGGTLSADSQDSGSSSLNASRTEGTHSATALARPSRLQQTGSVLKHTFSFTDGQPTRNPDALQRWHKAIKKVTYGVSFSHALHTLRDMFDNVLISPDQLRHVKSLGCGSFAKVELCEYTPRNASSTCRVLVAVKRLKPTVMMKGCSQETFQQEVALLRKLRCGHIVELIGVGYSDPQRRLETMFMVQEYMNCGSMQRLLADQMRSSRKLFSNADALRWSVQVARGLAYLHECKPMVIHRDLKLENILMSSPNQSVRSMEAKLADFGLVALIKRRPGVSPEVRKTATSPTSRFAPGPPSPGGLQRQRSTPQEIQSTWDRRTASRVIEAVHKNIGTGVSGLYNLTGMTGSLLYMAPEVYMRLPYNEKVDVFSFGVVMFELFSRYMVLAAITVLGNPQEMEQYAERVSQGYRPPLRPQIPGPLRVLIQRCWAHNPDERPAMSEVVQTLLQIQRDDEVEEWDKTSRLGNCTTCKVQ